MKIRIETTVPFTGKVSENFNFTGNLVKLTREYVKIIPYPFRIYDNNDKLLVQVNNTLKYKSLGDMIPGITILTRKVLCD